METFSKNSACPCWGLWSSMKLVLEFERHTNFCWSNFKKQIAPNKGTAQWLSFEYNGYSFDILRGRYSAGSTHLLLIAQSWSGGRLLVLLVPVHDPSWPVNM